MGGKYEGKKVLFQTIHTESNSESQWVYPSEQMFYNAMKRKNWDPSENDMKVVVPIHNVSSYE